MKKVLIVLIWVFISSAFSARAQNYQGLWHGYITEYDFQITSGYILQVKEHKGNIISGRAYIYSKKYFVFQGILDFIGTIDKLNSKVTELVIVKSEMPTDMAYLCIKFLNLTFQKKAGKEILTGKWNGYSENSECRPGEVYLQRYIFDNPTQSDPIPEPLLSMITGDSTTKMSFLNTDLTPPLILDVKRTFLEFEITDYLRNDNDTVSVYFNRRPIISNLQIRNKPFRKTLRLDKLSGLNEVIIYAENLGGVPPNTCVLTVYDGVRRQSVNIFSSKQVSAVIYLNYNPNTHQPVYNNSDNFFKDELKKAEDGPVIEKRPKEIKY